LNPSLYIHIPICLNKCDYCDFFSIPIADFPVYSALDSIASPADAVVQGLIREISEWSATYAQTGWGTVYIGGGTPSLLLPRNIISMCSKIYTTQRTGLDSYSEWTIEANPEDITEDWLRSCSDAGINRLSIGVQSLDDRCLAAVGRRGSSNKTQKALELVSRVWKGRLSLDMIAGLPGQTLNSLIEDLSRLVATGADHLSLYSLTIEDETPLARRLREAPIPLMPDEDESADMWIAGRDFLARNGFIQYEISNFCRPGCESKHNLTYWNLRSYIGVGPGATGTIIEGDRATRYTNTRNIAEWLENPASGRTIEHIGRTESIQEVILMGMRLSVGIEKRAFSDRFGGDILSFIPETATQWIRRGLLLDNDERIALTSEGLLYLNGFLRGCVEELTGK